MMTITHELAAFAAQADYASLPERVRDELPRTFLNWMGCVLGGAGDPAVESAVACAADAAGAPHSSLIGHGWRTDMATAAFVNCLSSSVLSFDDTHLATVTHPTGPVVAAIFAYCERHTVSGKDFLAALAVGMEIECRMSNVLLLPPAQANLGLFITGITGPIGAAAALGRLMRLDEEKMRWAIGLAAAQAAGLRATHGAMSAFFVPAHAARSGVSAAMLAAKGLTCTEDMLESPRGLAHVFAKGADLGHATRDLGHEFELLANAYKPYPSGIVVHPIIDACLEIAEQLDDSPVIASVALKVHPLALELTGRREPKNPVEAQISLFHWAAACLIRRTAGLDALHQQCIDDPEIAAWRARIDAVPDPTLQRDAAIAEVTLANGVLLRSHVEHARGSLARPMTDAELEAKFDAQAAVVLSTSARNTLLRRCRNVAQLSDVGRSIAAAWDASAGAAPT